MLHKNGKTIIVSADDFGISRLATANILKLAQAGKLDRIEVMVSKNILPQDISSLLASGVKMDIHFHLAKDKLDHWQNNPRIIEKGALKRIFLFLYNFLFGHNRPKIIEREWEQQIQSFQKMFGRRPDGASSHEHIHFFPPYFKRFMKLSKKYKLNYIRFGENSFSDKNKVSVILNLLRCLDFPKFKKSALETSDYMVSFDWIRDFDGFISSLPDGKKIEVIFHPELKNEFEFLEKF